MNASTGTAATHPDKTAYPQEYAKAAGVLFLLTMIFGFLGEMFIPGNFMVAGDAAATVARIRSSELLFRFGFASYLVEALCDIALSMVFYVLLRPVHRNLALATAFFGLVSTAVFAVGEAFYLAPLLLLGSADYLRAFTPDQITAMVMLSLKMFGHMSGIFMVFYGTTLLLRGYLIYRSTYLPRFIGVFMMLGGAGFIAKNLTLVLAPSYSSNVLLAPMFLAGLSLMVWMLAKGVDLAKWEAHEPRVV